MRITEKLRTEFPGIYASYGALKRAWKAYQAYNKAIKAVSTTIFTKPSNEWAYNVSERSRLSYEEAYRIYTVITEETDLCKSMQSDITEFVMGMANRGHTAEMIIFYLQLIEKEVNEYAYDKLRIR